MTRIRYTKGQLCIHSNKILADDDVYNVVITLKNHLFIFDSRGNAVTMQQCESVRKAKELAKKELIELGAKFFDEVRRKGKV